MFCHIHCEHLTPILNKTAKEFGLKTLIYERKKFSAKFAEWQEEVKSQFTQLLEEISQSP